MNATAKHCLIHCDPNLVNQKQMMLATECPKAQHLYACKEDDFWKFLACSVAQNNFARL